MIRAESDPPQIQAARGETVVVVPLYGGHDLFVACLRSVLRHTPAQVPVLVCDDASPDSRSAEFVAELIRQEADGRLHLLRQPSNLGFPGNVNTAFDCAAPADVIILNSDCEVGSGWFEGLRDAAYSDATVASATTLTNHGTIVSAPGTGPGPLPPEWTIDAAAAAISAASLRLRPRLPTAVGHCVYIRRSALDLVGGFDLAFSPGYGEEVDFSQRCLRAGLCHVVADDVYVLHHGGSSFERSGNKSEIQLAHEAIINGRYPYYASAVAAVEREGGQLGRAVSVARRALHGRSVLVDVRVLAAATTGTQIHIVELLGALSRVGDIHVSALVPERISAYGAASLARLPNVAQLTREDAEAGPRFDLVHRPFQVNNVDDMVLLRGLGERLVVTNQDLIGYHNPAYFPDYAGWAGYREITRAALAGADGVLFFSHHAKAQALAENLVEPHRCEVVHIGVDHVVNDAPAPVAPRGLETLGPDVPLVLCIGTDFHHKNRVFALRVLAELRCRHGWPGKLVLAGPQVAHGSSHGQEAELLSLDPELSAAVIELGAVTEAEKVWLYERAALAFYPTVHEGFGLVPFEAATHDRPCMWAPGTSLSEILDDGAAAIVPWDIAATAEAALRLLSDPDAAAANLAVIRAGAEQLSWDATAVGLSAAYRRIVDSPPVPGLTGTAAGPGGGLLELSEDAINLVGPGGALPDEMQRPLLALATHRVVSTPVFAVVRAAYRLGYALAAARRASLEGSSSTRP